MPHLWRRRPLWYGLPMLLNQPVRYLALVFLAPSASVAIAAAVFGPWWAVLPAFIGTLVAMWLVQYFLFM